MYQYKDFKDCFWGPNGFEELKKYMRLGNDFCKDLASILTERAEHELAYSKGLNRTSGRLQKLAKDFHGSLSEAWLQVSIQFDAEADAHKSLAAALQEEIVKPVKILAENQMKCRKPVEIRIDKVLKNLADKKGEDYKYRSRCIQLSKDIEKLMYNLDEAQKGVSGKPPNQKEIQKIETQITKTKEYLEKSELKYHKSCAAVELARQDWQIEMIKACSQMQIIEVDRINSLEQLIKKLSIQLNLLSRRMLKIVDVFSALKVECNEDIRAACRKYGTAAAAGEKAAPPEQEIFLYDIYAENTRNMMNKDRRIANLTKWSQMFHADVQAQLKARNGLEKVKSFARENPNFNANNDVEVEIKLESVGLMQLLYEASLFKVQSALAELLDTKPRPSYAHASRMTTTYDKQGVPLTVLRHSALAISSSIEYTSLSSAAPSCPSAPISSAYAVPHSPSLRSVSSLANTTTVTTAAAAATATPASAPLISMPMPVQIGFTLLNSQTTTTMGAAAPTYDSSSHSSGNNYESSSASSTASSVSPDSTSSPLHHHHHQHHQPHQQPPPPLPPQHPPSMPTSRTNNSTYLLTTAAMAATSSSAAPNLGFDRPPSYIVATTSTLKRASTIENHYNNSSISDNDQDDEDDDDEWNDTPYKSIGKCVAQYDFKATRSDELNLISGAEIVILEKRSDGWWKGKLNDSVGLFPSTYVKES